MIDGRPPVPPHRPALPRRRRRGLRAGGRHHVGHQLRRPRRDGGPDRRDGGAADAGRQRRDLRQHPRHPAPRRRLVPGARHRRIAGHRRLHRQRRHRAQRASPRSRSGTPLREVIEQIGGGAAARSRARRRPVGGREPGAARRRGSTRPSATRRCGRPVPVSAPPGSSCSTTPPISSPSRAGVARFLAVESCGQCRHCKDDGLALAALDVATRGVAATRRRRRRAPHPARPGAPKARGATSRPSNRWSWAASWSSSPSSSPRTRRATRLRVEPTPIAELRDIADGRATLDDSHRTKQPDWTHDAVDSGQWPADRLDDHRR